MRPRRANVARSTGVRLWQRPSLALTCSVCLIYTDPAQGQVVLDAVPSTAVVSTAGGTSRRALTRVSEREELRILVVKNGDSYLWVTRDSRELFHISPSFDSITTGTPVFHYFIDPSGGGYIKVLDQRGVPRDSLLRLEGGDVQFYEHVSQFLTTITYFGIASGFNP